MIERGTRVLYHGERAQVIETTSDGLATIKQVEDGRRMTVHQAQLATSYDDGTALCACTGDDNCWKCRG